MNRQFATAEDIFAGGEVATVRTWLKECLEHWFVSGDARSFTPFIHLFRPHFEAEDMLLHIYESLENNVLPTANRTAKGLFREATADLLLEPNTFRSAPFVYQTLIEFGCATGANEIIDALARIVSSRSIRLKAEFADQHGHTSEYNFLRTAAYAVSKAGFLSSSTERFLRSALYRSDTDIDLTSFLFVNLLRLRPDLRFFLAIEYANQIHSYILHRLQFDNSEFAKNKLVEAFNNLSNGQSFSDLPTENQIEFASSRAAFLYISGRRNATRLHKSRSQMTLVLSELQLDTSSLGQGLDVDSVTGALAERYLSEDTAHDVSADKPELEYS
jgi:hypothetical protein